SSRRTSSFAPLFLLGPQGAQEPGDLGRLDPALAADLHGAQPAVADEAADGAARHAEHLRCLRQSQQGRPVNCCGDALDGHGVRHDETPFDSHDAASDDDALGDALRGYDLPLGLPLQAPDTEALALPAKLPLHVLGEVVEEPLPGDLVSDAV